MTAVQAKRPGEVRQAGPVWFGPGRFGWGLWPLTWQGWLVVAVCVAAFAASAHFLSGPVGWIAQGASILAFVVIGYLTTAKGAGQVPDETDVE